MVVNIRLLDIIIVALALALSVQQSFSQSYSSKSEKPGWSLGIYAGVAKSKVVDETFSRELFNGYNPSFAISASYEGSKIQHDINISTINGNLTLNNSSNVRADQLLLNFDYSLLFKIRGNEEENFQMKLGPGIQVLYSDRLYSQFINRNHSYENIASVGLAADFQYTLNNVLQGITIVDKLFVPVISAYSNNASFDEKDEASLIAQKTGFGNIFQYKQIAVIPEVASFKNSIAIEKDVTNHHTIGLIYTWLYYQMNGGNKIKQANHQLALSYNYHF